MSCTLICCGSGGVLLIVLFLRLFDMCMCIGLLILFIVLYALFGCGSLYVLVGDCVVWLRFDCCFLVVLSGCGCGLCIWLGLLMECCGFRYLCVDLRFAVWLGY